MSAMQACGLEVRDVEYLREHYARTLRTWVGNLERHWDDAARQVGAARARIWRLYMAGSALGFEPNQITVTLVLGVVTARQGPGHAIQPLRPARAAADGHRGSRLG